MNPYIPESLPLQNLDYSKLITAVGEANAALAEYSGILEGIPNPAVLLSPLTSQEAVLSSKIEGTQATIEEVLEKEAGADFDDQKNDDIAEIQNYRKALILAQEYLQDGRPMTLNLALQIHKVLLDSVRGENKQPGEFRKTQNWIGPYGAKMEEASFVPPSPIILQESLEKLLCYLNEEDFDVLAQCAIMHAQFELLHPFCDGNGRIGRLLIPLFLFYKKRLSSPMFYLSGYLETNRSTYYETLRNISEKGQWTEWILFFLHAVTEQSKINASRVRSVMELYQKTKSLVADVTHSQHTAAFVDTLFDRPIFRTSDFSKRSGITKPTLHNLIRQLLEPNGPITTLKEAAGRRPAIYAFPALLNTCEGKIVI